jgi:hypothetical protein
MRVGAPDLHGLLSVRNQPARKVPLQQRSEDIGRTIAPSISFGTKRSTVMSTISVSEQVESALEYTGDVDTYDIYLTGLRTYEFDVKGKADEGGNFFYPKLAIYDGNRTRVAFNDNNDGSTDVHIDYEASSGGWYAVEVTGRAGSSGYYRLTSVLVVP